MNKPDNIALDVWESLINELTDTGRINKASDEMIITLAELYTVKKQSYDLMMENGFTKVAANFTEQPSANYNVYIKTVSLINRLMLTLGKPKKKEESDKLLNL